MTNEFISSEARRIRKKYHSSDPFEILKAMHVVIVYSDSYPRDGLKGFCTVFNRTIYVVINAKLSREEKRVVAAHELGHIILHWSELLIGAFKDSNVYDATGQLEREANLFGADLMITDEEVEECIAAATRISSPWPVR